MKTATLPALRAAAFLAAATGLFLAPAAADNLAAQRATIDQQNERLEEYILEPMNKACETSIKASIDWKSFEREIDPTLKPKDAPEIHAFCGEPLNRLRTLCRDDGFKDHVVKQVRSYVCQFDKRAAPSISLKKGALSMTANWSTEKHRDWAAGATAEQLRDGAWNLRQAILIRAEDAAFKKVAVAGVNSQCEHEIAASIDWKSFAAEVDKRLPRNKEVSIQAACSEPLARLDRVCGWGKKAPIQKNVKSFTCAFGGKKRALKLGKGALEYRVDFKAKDNTEFIDNFYIKKKLAPKKPPKSDKGAADLRKTLGEDSKNRGSGGKCKSGCSKKCSGASNKSKCVSRCRRACKS